MLFRINIIILKLQWHFFEDQINPFSIYMGFQRPCTPKISCKRRTKWKISAFLILETYYKFRVT